MPLEKDEYLWRMINEHMTQARHQETLRTSMTTLLVTLSGAIIGFITFDNQLTPTDLALAVLLVFLGTFGVFFSAKHYERFNFHIARVRSYRHSLEQQFPEVDWTKLRQDADTYHEARFSKLVKRRQHRLWLVLHGINAVLGVVLVALILFKTTPWS